MYEVHKNVEERVDARLQRAIEADNKAKHIVISRVYVGDFAVVCKAKISALQACAHVEPLEKSDHREEPERLYCGGSFDARA